MNTIKVYRIRSNELVVKRIRCTQTGSTKLALSGAQHRALPYPHEAKAWAIAHGWALTKYEARQEAKT